jgi:hypothetical protein
MFYYKNDFRFDTLSFLKNVIFFTEILVMFFKQCKRFEQFNAHTNLITFESLDSITCIFEHNMLCIWFLLGWNFSW